MEGPLKFGAEGSGVRVADWIRLASTMLRLWV